MAEPEQIISDEIEALPAEETIELDLEREKHRKRAEKFGVDFVEPGQRRELRDAARRERILPHRAQVAMPTGFDLFSTEEQEKQKQRAARFGTQTGLTWQAPQVPEDEEKKKQRAERFGVEYQPTDETGLMDVDLYEERKEVAPEVERRLDTVHVYGVDLMSTADILKYFNDYGATYVEWINDSSCNVLFSDPPTAKRAIAGLGKPLATDQLPEGVDPSSAANLEFLWHKGPDFTKAGGEIPLIFRIATVLDVKPNERVKSRRLWKQVPGGNRKYTVRRGGGVWQHDTRYHGDGDEMRDEGPGGGGEGVERKGRGRRMFKRKSGDYDDGDVNMTGEDGGHGNRGRRRRKAGLAVDNQHWAFKVVEKAATERTEGETREPVDYGDL